MAKQEILQEGALVRLKSGTEGWIKGQIVEYYDLIPGVGGMIYAGPGYKVHILEGKHKGETIRVPENYVESYTGPAQTKKEPLYPHVPGKKETLFPHVPKSRQVVLPQTEKASAELKYFWVDKNLPYETWSIVEAFPGGTVRSPFDTKQEAIKREQEIAEGLWEIKEVPSPQEKFPKQYEALKKLYPYEFIEYHDDGDLTIQLLVPPKGKKWPVSFRELVKGDVMVVTTDGQTFKQELLATIELLAKTEGDPLRKFCCRLCGECAPPELLEEGRFPDRIAWLRSHYKEKHPGMWGKRLPLTMIEDIEPISPEYRHLTGLISEPLPREAE